MSRRKRQTTPPRSENQAFLNHLYNLITSVIPSHEPRQVVSQEFGPSSPYYPQITGQQSTGIPPSAGKPLAGPGTYSRLIQKLTGGRSGGKFLTSGETESLSSRMRTIGGDPGLRQGFSGERYGHIERVLVRFEDGTIHMDEIRGLNRGHALARAAENWPTAKEIVALGFGEP